MKISELFATVKNLMARLDDAGKAELETFRADVTAKVEKFEADFNATIADLTAKLTQATTDLSAATGSLTEIKTSLVSAATALKLDLKADATPVQIVTAMQESVASTLAKLNVPITSIPATKPADTATASSVAGGKTMTMAEFRKLSPGQQSQFSAAVRAGVSKLVE